MQYTKIIQAAIKKNKEFVDENNQLVFFSQPIEKQYY